MAQVLWRNRLIGTIKRDITAMNGILISVVRTITISDEVTAPKIAQDLSLLIDFDPDFMALYLTPDSPDDYRHAG